MNFEEALAILGIDRSAGKKGARRAYLKLIKVHKPDRDPVMFRRVREAYECVKDRVEFFERLYTPAPEPTPPPPREPTPAPPPKPAPIGSDSYFESVLERTEAYEALLERDPPRPDPPRPVEIDERPNPLFERMRADSAEIDPLAPPRVDVLDEPLRLDPHAERPIRIEPRSAPPSEPPAPMYQAPARAFTRGPSPAALLAEAWTIFNDGGTAQAVERLARRAFAIAHVDPEADQPPPADAINLCLALFTNGRIIPARRLTRAMRAWLSETGLERQVMGAQLAARLAVLQALVDLPPDSPAFPIARVARAMRDGALDSAHAPLQRFTRETPFSALTSADHFRAHAPLLDGLYGELLRAGVATELNAVTDRVPARRGRGCLWIGAVMVALFALGALVRACDGSRTARYRTPRFSVPSIQIPKISHLEMPKIDLSKLTPPGEVSADDARRRRDFTSAPSSDDRPIWVRVLCKQGPDYHIKACAAATMLDRGLAAGDCEKSKFAISALRSSATRSTAQRGAAILALQQYQGACHPR